MRILCQNLWRILVLPYCFDFIVSGSVDLLSHHHILGTIIELAILELGELTWFKEFWNIDESRIIVSA